MKLRLRSEKVNNLKENNINLKHEEGYLFKINCITIVFIVIMGWCASNSMAGRRMHHEKWYQENYCIGESEVTMPDRTRCDCVTATYAIEYDFANKWCEAIGQSLHYALQTGKRAGIFLIIEKSKDRKYLDRLNSVIEQYNLPITVWTVGAGK